MQQAESGVGPAPDTQAAPGGWFTCEVIRAGAAEDGNIPIALREVGGQFGAWRWFLAVTQERKEMLATALTAITTGLHVVTRLTTTDQYGTIDRLYIIRDA